MIYVFVHIHTYIIIVMIEAVAIMRAILTTIIPRTFRQLPLQREKIQGLSSAGARGAPIAVRGHLSKRTMGPHTAQLLYYNCRRTTDVPQMRARS